MDDQNRNLILATALSFLVILVWFLLFPPEEPPAPTTDPEAAAESAPALPGADADTSGAAIPGTGSQTTEAALAEVERFDIETPRLTGSISLTGGRIDDLHLSDYRVTLDPEADTVTLLKPEGTDSAYYALFGWAPGPGLDNSLVPGRDTEWTRQGAGALSPGQEAVLTWDNGAGLEFRRTFTVDEDYMFTVRQEVTNTTDAPVRLAPYGLIARHGQPDDLRGFFIIHEGAIRQTGRRAERVQLQQP